MYLSCLMIDLGNNPDRPRPGRLWLKNRYHVHQRLCMAFPSDPRKKSDPDFLVPYKPSDFPEQRELADCEIDKVGQSTLRQVHSPRNDEAGFLFRIDPLSNGRVMILVQSALQPDWDYAFHNAEFLLAAPPMIKPFEPHFSQGRRLRFRLAVNPTRRLGKSSPDAKEESVGKRVPVPTEKLFTWLERKAEVAGFQIQEDQTTVQPGYIYFKKDPPSTEEAKGTNNKRRTHEWQRLRSVLFEGLLRVSVPDAFQKALLCGIGSGKTFGFGLLSVSPISTSGSEEIT